ncbi:MAG: GNAT family N-acetyltransferase [Actinomycetota bacterium]
MREPIEVRLAREADLDRLMELWLDLDRLQRRWRVFAEDPDEAEARREHYREMLVAEDDTILVAEDESGVVGMAVLRVQRPSPGAKANALSVSNVSVEPGRQRRGVGRALLEATVDFAREREIEHVAAWVYARNHRAQRFWSALGLEPVAQWRVAKVDEVGRRLGQGRNG